ncbi:hypothetical protein [Sorangium sp. So ce1151]|uniref:hypothetical protein n=1 Tax=Sorangium sp. So ce1151 TaxID=3133332 RepID=UPI003F646BF4
MSISETISSGWIRFVRTAGPVLPEIPLASAALWRDGRAWQSATSRVSFSGVPRGSRLGVVAYALLEHCVEGVRATAAIVQQPSGAQEAT